MERPRLNAHQAATTSPSSGSTPYICAHATTYSFWIPTQTKRKPKGTSQGDAEIYARPSCNEVMLDRAAGYAATPITASCTTLVPPREQFTRGPGMPRCFIPGLPSLRRALTVLEVVFDGCARGLAFLRERLEGEERGQHGEESLAEHQSCCQSRDKSSC